MDSWLPAWADQYGVVSVGALAALMGLSGLVRRESGALSRDERQTPLGRLITPLMSAMWFIIGALLLYSRTLAEPARSDTVGFSAIIGSIAILSTLILALIYYALPLPNKRSASLEAGPAPNFRRYEAVMHPQYGEGRVLACYSQDSIEMVAVRFNHATAGVPAHSLARLPRQ